MRKMRILAIGASLAMIGAGFAIPARAATGAGGVVFEGTATLGTFPCDPGPCTDGSMEGLAAGTAAGVDGLTPFSATFVGSTLATTSLSYTEPKATCPLTGTASGDFEITGGTGVATYGTDTYSGADVWAEGSFSWSRTGLVATIHTSVTIHIGPHTVAGLTDYAVAGFVPHSQPDCASSGSVDATVAGVDIIPGSSILP
jgi:hypothetical protein